MWCAASAATAWKGLCRKVRIPANGQCTCTMYIVYPEKKKTPVMNNFYIRTYKGHVLGDLAFTNND